MDNITYLEQISASNRPVKSGGIGGLMSPKILLILGGVAILAIIIIIVGMLSGSGTSGVDLVSKINVRSDNLIATINTYNQQVKSSELRSIASSLSSVLTETSSKTSELLNSVYNQKKVSDSITKKETTYIEEVDADLEAARLNGLLDRNFARQLTLQTGLLLSIESECLSKTKNNDVKNVVSNSYANLATIYETLSNYSDSTS